LRNTFQAARLPTRRLTPTWKALIFNLSSYAPVHYWPQRNLDPY